MLFSDTNSGNDGQSSEIPIIDLAPLNLSEDLVNLDPYKDLHADDPIVNALAVEVVKALSDIGFCYLVNHAISKKLICTFNKKTEEFFKLSRDVKENYYPHDPNDTTGWQDVSEERINEKGDSEPDYKQVYNICPTTNKLWPDDGFKEAVLDVYQSTVHLSLLTLKLVGIGLKLEDPDYFLKVHNMTSISNPTTIRACYYPPVPKDIAERDGIMRCGEHSDWGSISFVYQDNIGGLEKHRVVIPKEDFEIQHTRRSIVFFAMPDDDVSVECLDGSNKYPPISLQDYKVARLAGIRGDAPAVSN